MSSDDNHTLAGIQYSGLPGISSECQHAVMRLLQYGDRITRVRILTCSGDHCLLLTVNVGDLIAIKSGFGSGYIGEGSHTFSYVLQLLEAHGAQIEEYEVSPDIIECLDNSSLTMSDIESLDAAIPIRPTRWHDYVFEKHWESEQTGTLWQRFPPLVPFAIIDSRIIDLAISFWEDPDERLLTGYRRLEDIVRKRTGIDEHGAKLFSQAFVGPTAKLGWKDADGGERTGRASLFTGAYMAYRNPRAHREVGDDANDQLAEFLLLNH
ncbi:MAG: TIGR02391 family protein, partial [Nitrososphaera sp.]|nr:TIGR02391 family protein [Nitrososphaera sp.]